MAVAVADKSIVAPRVAVLLPVAYMVHLAEEWFGGLSAWTQSALGNEISVERFMLINAIALPIFVVGTWAAFRFPRMVWFVAMFAAVLALNGVLHALATLGFGEYSPGMVTGLVLSLPVSIMVLRACATRLTATVLFSAMLAGVLLHGLISWLAFL